MIYNIAMELKQLRKQIGLTQTEASVILGIPFRTYCRYEDDEHYRGSFKYNQMMSILNEKKREAILNREVIVESVKNICSKYNISACYLFGSYAKNKAREDSDVDLMIVSEIEGIEYYQLVNEFESALGKKVDLIRLEAAIQNVKLMNEILKDGVKLYG